MDRLRRLGAPLAEPLRYGWIYLAIPTLVTAGHVSLRQLPATWLAVLLMTVAIGLPLHLTYLHAFERLAGSDLVSLRAVPFHLVAVPGWVLVGVELGGVAASPLLDPDGLAFWKGMMRRVSLFGAPVVTAGIVGYERYRDRLEEVRTRALRAQREALSAQVQALQARLQPHFLFNSLNTVASLIGEDPKRAESALERISALVRYALEASDRPLVPLAEELESVESFLEVERLRFPERLRVAVRVEPGTGTVPVPPLFLQPLVENAVLHGIAPRREGGRLEVEVQRGGGVLRIRVEDDGPGPGGSSHRGSGSALADLRKRLELLYGDRASLGVERGELGGFRVIVRLPLWTGPGSAGRDGA